MLIYVCQILDSWRTSGGDFGGSQIYKTEASWGLLIPLISFLIISSKKLINDLHILNLEDKNFYAKTNKNKPVLNPIIFTLVSYAFSTLIINFLIFYPKYILASGNVPKPTLEGVPQLMLKKDFLKSSRKCGVIDSWHPGAWLIYDAQPCLGVFINSAPGILDNDIFKNDMKKLIERDEMTIRGIPEINKSDLWPVYSRQFADQIKCEKVSAEFELVCKKKSE